MLKNYLKIAYRNLVVRKGYSLLNIIGLAIGIACCLLIFQYVSFEKSYDQFPPKAKDIVRLRLDSRQQGTLSWQSATVYPAFGPTLKKDFPEVEDFCRLHDADFLLSNDEREVKFNENQGYFADPSFIRMFNLQFVKGNPLNALDGPDKIVLSEPTAKKYFGEQDPLGKRLVVRDPSYTRTLLVTGVFKSLPTTSHLTVNHLASYATLSSIVRQDGDTSNPTETSFGWYDFYTYLQLKPGTDVRKLESKFPAFCDRYINNREWSKKNNVRSDIYLMPLEDIHLHSNYNQEAEANGNGQAVSFLFMIAFLIIIIAWVNYINLATARSMERAKEVGVRKVLGALRTSLIKQFLTESFLLNIAALILAAIIIYLVYPAFNQLSGHDTRQGFSLSTKYWLIFASIFLGGSLLSGIYPAFVLSRYQPIMVLKGFFKNSASGLLLRKSLIVLQFATSIILIIGTIIVYQQVGFMRKQKLGVNINQTMVLDGAGSITDSVFRSVLGAFKADLLHIKGIKNVTASSSVMGKEIYWTNRSARLGALSKGSVTLYNVGIDHDFIPSFGLQLKAGRNFSKEIASDSSGILINEEAAKLLGFTNLEEAVKEKIFSAGDTVRLLGIVSNYHHMGLQKTIDPILFRLRFNSRSAYSIKLEAGDMQSSIAAIQKTWSRFFPAEPFSYYFLDNSFDQQYKNDQIFGKIFGLFASLAILIACFGLLGLSAYNVFQRTKEIGIRKVLGASVNHLLFLLSKEFLLLVFISFVIASPITWWIMNNWLQSFAYRIDIQWWAFAIAGIAALAVALFTVSFQAIKAAMANPVKSLRTE